LISGRLAIGQSLAQQRTDLTPDPPMFNVRRVESESEERVLRQAEKKHPVPTEADHAPPGASHAINERLRTELLAGRKIVDRAQRGGVAKSSINDGAPGFCPQ